jgi:inosine/guanosine/xanthosine phosphorylase family protein
MKKIGIKISTQKAKNQAGPKIKGSLEEQVKSKVKAQTYRKSGEQGSNYFSPAALRVFAMLLQGKVPHWHVVLGSGFGQALHLVPSDWQLITQFSFSKVPDLTQSSVQDHPGQFRLYHHSRSGKFVLFQMGRLHGYEGHSPRVVVSPVMLSRALGTVNYLLTNAAGGLDTAMRPGDVVILNDFMNLTGLNPLVGKNPQKTHQRDPQDWGPRFPDMGFPFEPLWQDKLLQLLKAEGLTPHKGAYIGVLGPHFETHFEIKLFSSWGLKAVGMSTVWEVIALRHSGARLAGMSLIANLGAGLSPEKLKHEQIIETCRASAAAILRAALNFLVIQD